MVKQIENINFQINDVSTSINAGTLSSSQNSVSTINYSNLVSSSNYRNNNGNNKVEEIDLDEEIFNDRTEKYVDGIEYIYNGNGHLIQKIKKGIVVYEEYSNGQVKSQYLYGCNVEYNDDGTIKKLKMIHLMFGVEKAF